MAAYNFKASTLVAKSQFIFFADFFTPPTPYYRLF